MDLSGYASGPIKRCLFIGYIIIGFTDWTENLVDIRNPVGVEIQVLDPRKKSQRPPFSGYILKIFHLEWCFSRYFTYLSAL